MSQITLWNSIKALSSWFPSFASLLLYTFISVAEGVSLIFLFLLSFSTNTICFHRSSGRVGVWYLFLPPGPWICQWPRSCYLWKNINAKWDVVFTGRGTKQNKTTERLENTKRRGESESFMERRFLKFSKKRHWRLWDSLWARDSLSNFFSEEKMAPVKGHFFSGGCKSFPNT